MLLYSCEKKETITSKDIYNPQTKLTQLSLDTFAKDMNTKKLDSTYGEISNLLEVPQGFFINWNSIQISEYSNDGKFVRNIGATGSGPGESSRAPGLDYNVNDSTLYTFDFPEQKLIVYKNGNFLNSIPYRKRTRLNTSHIQKTRMPS